MEEVREVLDMTGSIWGVEKQAMVDALWRDMNMKRLRGGWSKPDDDETKQQAAKQMVRGEVLQEDWSHLRKPENILVPNWRHPYVRSFRTVRGLSDTTRLLALISAHTASSNLSRLRQDWTYLAEDQHQAGLEMVLQSVTQCGFPRVYNALRTLHAQGVSRSAIHLDQEHSIEAYGRRGASGGEDAMPLKQTGKYDVLVETVSTMHPDLLTWILDFEYGEVYPRECPGLTSTDRELAAIGCLATASSLEELRFHIMGALKAGASLEQIRGILDQTGFVWGRNSQAVIDGLWLEFAHIRSEQDMGAPIRAFG